MDYQRKQAVLTKLAAGYRQFNDAERRLFKELDRKPSPKAPPKRKPSPKRKPNRSRKLPPSMVASKY